MSWLSEAGRCKVGLTWEFYRPRLIGFLSKLWLLAFESAESN